MQYLTLSLKAMLALGWLPLAFQSPTTYSGKLNTELFPERSFNQSIRFDPASDADKSKLPTPLAAGDRAFFRNVKWPPGTGAPLALMLVEPAQGAPYLYADTNLDGKFSANERVPFPTFKANPGPEDDVIIQVSYKFTNTIYQTYPLTLRPRSINGEAREVYYSYNAYARGVVDIGGQKTLVQYGITTATGKSDPTQPGLAMDTNGDGRIDTEAYSPELDFGNHGAAIFRVGNHYVSTESVDTTTGKIILKSHPASEYERVELTLGATMPDFSFIDFKGTPRKLSDFRGKYVLLDFWGTWCGPCLKEMPKLKEVYDKYRARNFEVIGMNNEVRWDDLNAAELAEAIERAKTLVTKRGYEWTQARTDSIDQFVKKRLRVNIYPMKLLLDPQGRIVLLLSDEGFQELTSTLEKLLPPTSTVR